MWQPLLAAGASSAFPKWKPFICDPGRTSVPNLVQSCLLHVCSVRKLLRLIFDCIVAVGCGSRCWPLARRWRSPSGSHSFLIRGERASQTLFNLVSYMFAACDECSEELR